MNGNITLPEFIERIRKVKSERDSNVKLLRYFEEQKQYKQSELEDCNKARAVVQKVAEETQNTIEFQISKVVTLALESIFPDPYEFKLRFTPRRNRTECDLVFIKNGEEVNPLSAAGGGVVDVAGFALRIAIWSLRKNRPTIVLDEPFRFLSVDLQSKCSKVMKELSSKLGLQIILISHLPNIIDSADTILHVENKNGISQIGG